MDSIDITDSAFSLDVPDISESLGSLSNDLVGGSKSDYTIYIYIGVAILAAIIGFLIYNKFYKNKYNIQQNEKNLDCSGGFCTMGEN
jgi:ABC-type anion transport system duplicated permease subunit